MPSSGKLSVGVWKIRFREKWNMVKIDELRPLAAILDEWRS
jgi:hypothetical protein